MSPRWSNSKKLSFTGTAASITVFPIVPDYEKYPDYGRDLDHTFGGIDVVDEATHVTADGRRERLDDVLDRQWTILHVGAAPAGAAAWAGAPCLGIGRDIHDHTGALTSWLRGKKATAVVIRPDGFIYAATDSTHPLPAPPQDLNPIAEIRNGVPA